MAHLDNRIVPLEPVGVLHQCGVPFTMTTFFKAEDQFFCETAC